MNAMKTALSTVGLTVGACLAAVLMRFAVSALDSAGCVVRYYEGTDFGRCIGKAYRFELSNDYGLAAPALFGPSDNWSARWRGVLRVVGIGDYQFITQNTGGLRLLIDGKIVVDNWNSRSDWAHSTKKVGLSLDAGDHTIVVEICDRGGGTSFWVRWCGPGMDAPVVVGGKALSKR